MEHIWVVLQYTPVDVVEKPDGTLDVHATEGAIEIAVEEALYGCWQCNSPLTTETFHSECVPPSN